MTYENILIEPVLTEKTNAMREEGKYVFKVTASATKTQVKEAVRRLFNVHPVDCTMLVVGGKPKRIRQKAGYTSSWKKAMVRLQKDEKIALFESV